MIRFHLHIGLVLTAAICLLAGTDAGSAPTATTAPPAAYDLSSQHQQATQIAGIRHAANRTDFDRVGRATGSLPAGRLGVVAADTAGALTENQIGSTTEDILANATRGNVSKAAQYIKTGGMDQANSDFDLLTRGVHVVDQGGGLRTATLSNGTNVTVRPFSTGKFPTLDIRTPGNLPIKVRY